MIDSVKYKAGALLCFQLCFMLIFTSQPHAGQKGEWRFGISTGIISGNDPMGVLYGQYDITDGDAGGRLYLFNAEYTIKTINLDMGGKPYPVAFEIVSSLGAVDENVGDPFFNCNTAFAARWIKFPWDRHLSTTLMTGIGLNYSEEIFLMDIQKHPNEHRSRVKFFWPLEITFSLPGHENHQLVLFNHHISGGWIMDKGGIDFFGIGYRYLFGGKQ